MARWNQLAADLGRGGKRPDPALLADALLTMTGQGDPPVDLSKVIRAWPRLVVSVDNLDGPGYLLDLGNAGGEVLLRQQDSPVRRRFTLAHELGHWLLGESATHPAPDPYRPTEPAVDTSRSNTALERWCDEFATDLLLPAKAVSTRVDACAIDLLPDLLMELPAQFRASRSATWLRVSELTDVSIILRRTNGRDPFSAVYFSEQTPGRLIPRLRRWAEALAVEDVTAQTTVVSNDGWQIAFRRDRGRSDLLIAARLLS